MIDWLIRKNVNLNNYDISVIREGDSSLWFIELCVFVYFDLSLVYIKPKLFIHIFIFKKQIVSLAILSDF